MFIQRFFLPMINALGITLVLIYSMHLLIKSDQLELSDAKSNRVLDFIHIPENVVLKPKKNAPPKPNKIEEQPIIKRFLPTIKTEVENTVGELPVKFALPDDGINTLVQSDQLTLVFGYPPIYPASLANKGIEGYVQVGFSVNAAGDVYDEHVIEAQPKGAFERSALKAIVKFRYKPRYDDQRPIDTKGQSYVFRFELETQ